MITRQEKKESVNNAIQTLEQLKKSKTERKKTAMIKIDQKTYILVDKKSAKKKKLIQQKIERYKTSKIYKK